MWVLSCVVFGGPVTPAAELYALSVSPSHVDLDSRIGRLDKLLDTIEEVTVRIRLLYPICIR
jgi:hypothetical protein